MRDAGQRRTQKTLGPSRRGGVVALALALLLLAGCDSGKSGSAGGDATQPLASTPWCDQPNISFQDDSTANQTILSKWDLVKGQLGFTPYLPPSLPKGSCLALAGGSIHDPVFGAKFSITYSVPLAAGNTTPTTATNKTPIAAGNTTPTTATNKTPTAGASNTPLAFSEAPKRANIASDFECVASAQDAKTTICQGVIASTTLTMASRQSSSAMMALFQSLQPNLDWVPAVVPVAGTPTPTGA